MRLQRLAALAILVLVCAVSLYIISAEPEGALLTYVSNSTKNATAATGRNDSKGTITVVNIDTVQQNGKWKAYVGNVTGTLVLRDANDYSIYEWPLGGSPSGEVYITRNETIDWASIQCANATSVTNEETSLSISSAGTDSINNTFGYFIHAPLQVGEILVTNSTCKSTATYINSTAQSITEAALFQEVLLMDDSLRLVYATIINQDTSGYRDDVNTTTNTSTTFDFQALVPDYTTTALATYYFYVDITG